VIADQTSDLFGCGLLGGQAGDAVHDLFGQSAAEVVEGVSADPEHLGGAGELDAVGGCDPDSSTHDPAVTAVFGHVVLAARRGRGQRRGDLCEQSR